jgi:hypothetical protein
VTPDTSALADGTYEVKAVATDAADQPSVATAVLRVDRHAPEKPLELAVERNPDATLAFVWRNPDQGVAAPINAARYAICDAAGANCVAGDPVSGENIARLPSVAVPAGEHVVRVWLQDAAGHADPATAATLVVDPTTISARRAVGTNPPALRPDDAPSPGLRVTRVRRSGSTLTLTGTIARAATATISAKVSRQRGSKSLASGKAKPKAGKWTLKVRLTSTLRRAGAVYVTVTYAGQQRYRKATLQRRVSG